MLLRVPLRQSVSSGCIGDPRPSSSACVLRTVLSEEYSLIRLYCRRLAEPSQLLLRSLRRCCVSLLPAILELAPVTARGCPRLHVLQCPADHAKRPASPSQDGRCPPTPARRQERSTSIVSAARPGG